MLDYDGTLAPFQVDRFAAFPLPGVVDALHAINTLPDTRLALISGRPVAEVERFVGASSFIIAGTHGFELYLPGMGLQQHALDASLNDVLDTAAEEATLVVGPNWTERKVATVAAHTRQLSPEEAELALETLAERWVTLTTPLTEVRRFNGGLEMRVRGRDKGSVVRELLALGPEDAFAVYIGDDETDEDAFRALPADGIGIRVGAAGVASAARGRLASCETVRELLWDWAQPRRGR
jgi:trehalose-phosphatase